MAQFDVYRMRGNELVVDIQSPMAALHPTRLVIPLLPIEGERSYPISRLNPQLTLDGTHWILGVHYATTIDAKLLNSPIGSLADEEWTIKAAVDFLISGF